jgi:hypothetical protein
MSKTLTISSPSQGSETDLHVPFRVGHELWALWAAGLIESPRPPPSEEETSIILPAHSLIDINPPCRIEEIVDENSEARVPAIPQSPDSSNLELQESLDSRSLVPFVENFVDPTIELSVAEDPVVAVADVVKAKVRYLRKHLNDPNPARTRRKPDKPVPANNLFGRSGRRRCLQCRKWRQKVPHLVMAANDMLVRI